MYKMKTILYGNNSTLDIIEETISERYDTTMETIQNGTQKKKLGKNEQIISEKYNTFKKFHFCKFEENYKPTHPRS